MNNNLSVIAIVLAVIAFCYALVHVEAATRQELQLQIEQCQQTKEVAHTMADCARALGYGEEHIIIQTAKERWMEAYTEELNLYNQMETATTWTGPKLTRSKGVNYGPNGKETYYNLPMNGVVQIMRRMGYDEFNYPYWVRDDGVKMLGDYVMIATNFRHWPRGSIVETSLGMGLSCDTGHLDWNQVDIAVSW